MTVSPAPQEAIFAIDGLASDPLEQILQQALGSHQSGQIEIAESLYRTILEVQPNHPDANHNLGVLAVQVKQACASLPYFAAALQAQPEQQQYWLSYIDALIQADEAETAKQMLELGRQHGLHGNDMETLAARLEGGTQTAEFIDAASQLALSQSKCESGVISIQPGKPDRQAALHSGGRKTPVLKKFQAVVNLANKGRLKEAEVLARSITTRFPGYGHGWKLLGTVLQQQGRPAEALGPAQKAVELMQEDAEAHCNLSAPLQALGRLTEAEASLRRALKIKPNYFMAHNNLGGVLRGLEHLSEAEASYRQALKIQPEYGVAYNNLGNLLQDIGRLSEAKLCYRQALKTQPDYAVAHSNLLFCMSLDEMVDAPTLFAEHCRFGVQFEVPLQAKWQQHNNPREQDRCLQVGFISGDLHNHALASFIEPVLAHLAAHINIQASFSLHAYANHSTDDSVTQRLRGYMEHWHQVVGLSDAALAEKIRADRIDILIDLSGHTGHNRLPVFARKPAPVQISWMGYPGTTGLSSMDYYLTDRFLLPPGQFDHQFTEKLVHLPANAPFLPSAYASSIQVLPALANGYVTFGSFNRLNKISQNVIKLWSQLLRAVPDSRMVLGAMPQEGQYDTLIAWFAGEGIARERLDFRPRSGIQSYLALHHQVDVCLDTFPYTGGTTTLHALWMGVPTLTLAGSTVAARTGAGILGHVGLNAFVAQDAAAFVRQGLLLAADVSTLAELRSGLRERFSQSVPSQPEVIATGLESALRTMWQHWCAGLPAKSFEVSHTSVQNSHNPMQEAEA
jgi:protein O-GlcNAc transferase